MSEAGDQERGAAGPDAEDVAHAGEEAFGDELPGASDAPIDEVDLREIMRNVLDNPPAGGAPNILKGVQRKLRVRSRGKFYADGWSTSQAPRSTYLVTSLFMLALIALVFLVLIPWGSGALTQP